MIDIKNYNYLPTIDEISAYIKNPLFDDFYTEIVKCYKVQPKIEFSKCSWEYGWNIKFKKSGKNLCTVYPRENYFTVLIVLGVKEKLAVEAIFSTLSPTIQEIYHQTKEGNGQRWLMINLEDKDKLYRDVLELINIRSTCK